MDKMSFGGFCWNELSTPNIQAAKDFYSRVLGWQFVDHDMGDMTYTMIKNGDKEFGGMWQIPKDKQKEIPPHWLSYILVKNVEETLKKATDSGAKTIMPVTGITDFGRFAIIQDPTGAHIAFWESLR